MEEIRPLIIVLIIGSFAAYALMRFQYRPKPGLILAFIGCGTLSALLVIVVGLAWPFAIIIGLALYLIIAQTMGRRFKGALSNDDIAFWLISQRMLPPVAVILPIFMMFVGGLQIIRSGVLVASVPLLLVGVGMMISLRKSLQSSN